MRKSLLLLVVIVWVAACHRVTDSSRPGLGEKFTVKFGQQVLIRSEALTVKLDSVTDDSRCPKNSECFWAGNARIVLEVNGNSSLALNTYLEPKEAVFHNYQFKLVDLQPYPEMPGQTKLNDYAAELIVTK
ncbi:MAG TPA: hypothetical protein VKA08_09485 [Balneolales bacterium]|nr:hypothetical protein [Balneolales bacterium]